MKKSLLLIFAMLLTAVGASAVVKVQGVPRPDIKQMPAVVKGGDASFSMDDIKNWTGEGSKRAAFVVQWNFDNEYVTETNALVFGYRFDGDNLNATDMIVDIVKNNPRLYMAYDANGAYGAAVNGLGYDANGDGYFFVYGPNEETIEFDEYGLYTGSLGGDDLSEVDPTDYWRSGWFSGYWSLFDGDGPNSLGYSSTGASGIALNDGTWVAFNFCTDMSSWTPPDFKPFVSAPSNVIDPFEYIQNWTGKGENKAAVTIQFNDNRETNAMTFGYRFDGETTGAEMLKAIVENNPRLYALMPRTYTAGLYGLGWDANDNNYFGLMLNGTEQTFTNHIVYDSNNSDNMTSAEAEDFWQTGWMMNGFWAYFTRNDAESDYEMSMVGYGERTVKDGCWDAWYFDADYSTFEDDPEWKEVVSAPVNPFEFIENWTGEGNNRAAVTIQFNDDRETNAMTFGYRFDGNTNGAEMLKAIVENNPRLYALMPRTYTAGLYGLGWDANDNQYFGLDLNGTEQTFTKHIVYDSNNSDNMTSIDPDDLWQTGWMMNGFWAYFTKDKAADEYEMSMVGYGERTVKNGSWDAWYFDADYSTFEDDPEWKEVVSAPEGVWRPIDLSNVNVTTIRDAENNEVPFGKAELAITFTDEEMTAANLSNYIKEGVNTSATFDWRNSSVVITPQAVAEGDAFTWLVDNSSLNYEAGHEYTLSAEEYAALAGNVIVASVGTRFNAAETPTRDGASNVEAVIKASGLVLFTATPNGDGSYAVNVADNKANCSLEMCYKAPTGVENVSDNNTKSEIVETTYYNSLGQRALRPYSGVNIVVNRHADGTVTTAKRIFR
ncbi:MAG: hypothetical protein IJS19_07495 [Muribaculaceae bacterium]|nr:hypothetical protein [Muribaculaceae bacterium]